MVGEVKECGMTWKLLCIALVRKSLLHHFKHIFSNWSGCFGELVAMLAVALLRT
jgi:hypothetical protein